MNFIGKMRYLSAEILTAKHLSAEILTAKMLSNKIFKQKFVPSKNFRANQPSTGPSAKNFEYQAELC